MTGEEVEGAMPLSFAVTWDYRCPFARNAHEHVLEALAAGADWQVRFVPFSLGQVHVAEGETDVWDEPDKDTGLIALQAGVVVRDRFPERFPAAHLALFAARHDHGLKIREPEVVRDALAGAGVDADAVFADIESGAALETVRKEHEASVADHDVWGVPTFLSGERAVFVRLMDRPQGDHALATSTIERVVALLDGWPELNEFKHTTRTK
jgi:2-hydroxychromene-2-carboxylate isomerase